MSGETIGIDNIESEAALASFILSKYQEWDGYREEAKSLWEEIEAYKYATDAKKANGGSNAFDHTNHIPVVAPIAQDLEAIITQVLFPHKDWFNFMPADRASASREAKVKVKQYINNRHKVSKFSKTARRLTADLIEKGNCFAMVEFCDESRENKKGYVGPKVRRISPYDIVFDPTATDFHKTAKIIREVISMGELWQRREKGLISGEAVDAILNERRTHGTRRMTNHEKNQQYIPSGFGTYDSYMTSGVVEILWLYGDIYDIDNGIVEFSRKIACVDGSHILLNEEIDTPNGIPMIYHATWQERPDNLWGMGPLDNIVGINHQVNHRENAKNDALDRLIYPDKVYVGDVEESEDEETGQKVFLAPEGGGVQELSVNTQFFQFDLEIDRMQQIARVAARLPLDLVGFRSPGEKTLGEVSALTDGAMRGFLHKARDYEEFYEEILAAELAISAEKVSSVIQVPGQAEAGVIPFYDITKSDLQVSGSLIPQGALRFSRRNQILSTLTQLAGNPIIQQAAPHFSGKALAKAIEELAELEEFGIVDEYAAIMEQAEASQVAAKAEQIVAGSLAEPTLQEEVLTQEMELGA